MTTKEINDIKELANDVIKYGILDTKESKDLSNLIMNRNNKPF